MSSAHRGRGVPKDYVEAYKWFALAATKSSPGKTRDNAIKGRDAVASEMTQAQIAEGQKLAREWKPGQ